MQDTRSGNGTLTLLKYVGAQLASRHLPPLAAELPHLLSPDLKTALPVPPPHPPSPAPAPR